MTLILGCLTADRIVVAADRRLTLPAGSLVDDDANKAVFYCGRCAIAYTGLAQIEGQDTSAWIARQLLSEDSVEPALEKMARVLEGIFGSRPVQSQRLAILAFGWATHHGQGPIRPYCCALTNFLDPARGWLDLPSPRFSIHIDFLREPLKNMVVVAGQPLHPTELTWLTRNTRSCVEHATGPVPYARLLGTRIRAISACGDARSARVGRSLIIQALSLSAINNGDGSVVTPLVKDVNSFLYMADDGSIDPAQGPIFVCGGTILADFKAGTLSP